MEGNKIKMSNLRNNNNKNNENQHNFADINLISDLFI